MRTKNIICAAAVILCLFLVGYIVYLNYNYLTFKTFENRIDSLTLVVDSLEKVKSKKFIEIEKINDTLTIIEKEYVKERNNILTMPTDSQCIIFSNYISENSKRFFDSNN